MSDDASIVSEVRRLWASGRGGAELLRMDDDERGEARRVARRTLDALLAATASEIPWGPLEAPRHDGPEGMLGIRFRAQVVSTPDRLFRLAKLVERDDPPYQIVIRIEWTAPAPATLPDHDEVARAVERAGARLRELVESPRFGAADLAALHALPGVVAEDLDPDDAFERRCEDDDDEDLDSTTNRLEQALGTLNGLVFRRRDFRVWSAQLAQIAAPMEALALERFGRPWGHEVALDLQLVLIAHAFPTSSNAEAERLRPLIERIESVLRTGGLVYGLRGRDTATAIVLACPGPLHGIE